MPFFERLAQLEREHASFAVATVVARRSPVSSQLGDRALIFADGRMEGFVGGSCSRDIVRRHAVGAIRNRQPVLLQIRPDSRGAADSASNEKADGHADLVVIPMSCSSEGAVDVYIEPRVPLRRLVIVGFTPVAEALANVAVALDYAVVRVVIDDELHDIGRARSGRIHPSNAAPPTEQRKLPSLAATAVDAERDVHGREDGTSDDGTRGVRIVELKALRTFLAGLDADSERELVAVVASQGHYDELALEALLERPIAFTGLLASRRRAETVAGVLTQQGLPAERIAAIHNPVGLDIGARSPGEVAVSILAQIIAHGKNLAVVRPDETPKDLGSGTPARESSDGYRLAREPRPLHVGKDHLTANAAPTGKNAQRTPTTAGGATDMPAFAAESGQDPPTPDDGAPNDVLERIKVDPVCGMDVETAHALYRYEHAEQTYVFCGAHCRASFSADPGHYLVPLGSRS